MAVDNTLIKSEKWASVLQSQIRMNSFIWMMIADTKFEGAFNGNGTVHFRRQAKIVLQDMATWSSDLVPTKLVETKEVFTLNKRKAFSTEVSNEEFVEMDIKPTSQAITDAKEAFARLYDEEIFSNYASASMTLTDGDLDTATNGGTTNAIIPSKANIYEIVRRVNLKMDKAVDSLGQVTGLSSAGRFLILSPDETFHLDAAPELLRSTTLWDKIVTGGFTGKLNGIDIYSTNLLSEVAGDRYALFGQGKPICFGANIKPDIKFVSSDTQATNFLNYLKGMTKYDTTVFEEGAEKLGYVKLQA